MGRNVERPSDGVEQRHLQSRPQRVVPQEFGGVGPAGPLDVLVFGAAPGVEQHRLAPPDVAGPQFDADHLEVPPVGQFAGHVPVRHLAVGHPDRERLDSLDGGVHRTVSRAAGSAVPVGIFVQSVVTVGPSATSRIIVLSSGYRTFPRLWTF